MSTVSTIARTLQLQADKQHRSIDAAGAEKIADAALAGTTSDQGQGPTARTEDVLELYRDGYLFSSDAGAVFAKRLGITGPQIRAARGTERTVEGETVIVDATVPIHKMRAGEKFSGDYIDRNTRRPDSLSVSFDGTNYWSNYIGYRVQIDAYQAWALWQLAKYPDDVP